MAQIEKTARKQVLLICAPSGSEPNIRCDVAIVPADCARRTEEETHRTTKKNLNPRTSLARQTHTLCRAARRAAVTSVHAEPERRRSSGASAACLLRSAAADHCRAERRCTRDANESVCARGVAIARPTRVVPKTRTVRLGNSH